MTSLAEQVVSTYAKRVTRLLERVSFRLTEGQVDLEAVCRLRYEAYKKQNLLERDVEDRLFDESYDSAPNGCSIMMFVDNDLASTVRLHVGRQPNAILPSLAVFSDVINPHLQAGELIVDVTRLAADYEMSRAYPELPYFAVRPAWMAAQYFNADYTLATTVEDHAAFYRRTFGYRIWCGPRSYPAVTRKIICMAASFVAVRATVEQRYPVFRVSDAECERLFIGRPELRRIAETRGGSKAPNSSRSLPGPRALASSTEDSLRKTGIRLSLCSFSSPSACVQPEMAPCPRGRVGRRVR